MITNKFKSFLNENVPQKVTNILYQIFNGIQAVLQIFEYRLNIAKRESNILTAQNLSSLRSLAAQNGFEPALKQSSKGILQLRVSPKLFNRVGLPLFIKPNTVFVNKLSKLEYIYIGESVLTITETDTFIPVMEGVSRKVQFTGYESFINRFYLETDAVAHGSITVSSNGNQFKQVKSFYDNRDVNDNRLFMMKFGSNAQQPIILYVMGLKPQETLTVEFIETNGSLGNIKKNAKFETDQLLDRIGTIVNYAEDEIQISTYSGFLWGSDGSDENTLRSAIGHNHDMEVLFDNVSYRNFLSRFNTVGIQAITINRKTKQINHIYLWNKPTLNPLNIVQSYRQIIHNNQILLSPQQIDDLDRILNENEYCLSSHQLHTVKTKRYAFQFEFETNIDLVAHQHKLEGIIYEQFSKFLYDRYHSIDVNQILNDYQRSNSVKFDWNMFIENSTDSEQIILHKRENNDEPYEEFNDIRLPILQGNFDIITKEGTNFKLFKDISFVVRKH